MILQSPTIVSPSQPLPVPPPGFEDDVSAGEVVRSASIAAEDASATTSSQSVVCQPAFLNSPGDEFSILLPPPAGFPAEETQQPEMETFDVTLVKDHQGLGITIAGYVCEKGKCLF